MFPTLYLYTVPVVERLYGVMTVVIYGMLAVWAVESRWHWFPRAVVLGTALGALLVLPAPELAIRIGIAQAMFMTGLALWRPRESYDGGRLPTAAAARRWPRIGLRDLMLLMLVAAAALTVGVQSGNRNAYAWLFTFVDGLVIAVMGWGCVWLAWGRARLAVRVAAAPLILAVNSIAAQVWLYWFTYGLTSFSHDPNFVTRDLQQHWADRLRRYYVTWPDDFWRWAVATSIGTLVFVAWLGVTRQAGWFGGGRPAPPKDGNTRESVYRKSYLPQLAAVFTALIVGPMLFLWSQIAFPTALPAEGTASNQNYADLVAVAKEIYKINDGNTDVWEQRAGDAQFAAAVARIEPQWQRVRAAIAGGVEFPWRPVDARRTDEMRHLSYVFIARAHRGDGTGALEPRIEAFVDAIQVWASERRSTSSYSGDFYAAAIESREMLWNLRNSLSAEQCKAIVQAIWTAEQLREPLEVSRDRSRRLMKNGTWGSRLSSFTQDWFYPHAVVRRIYRSDAFMQRILLTELAILAYEKQHGSWPDTISELVPDYLPAVPEDPFGDSPLQYQRSAGGYLLYSVGPDGVDNGGKSSDDLRQLQGIDWPSTSAFPPPRTPVPAVKPAPADRNTESNESKTSAAFGDEHRLRSLPLRRGMFGALIPRGKLFGEHADRGERLCAFGERVNQNGRRN